ncbi:MAG: translesion error-prone DNA polymerase V autoproteolytic subunit [Flavobacterium sp.]|jgi:DNA polymerase V|uniref:Translesion error-prone DNA polymerase V autoproteolytic subunit n=1 Tax=Flavobacterium macrobrachii TaxID=591204 RepID=A0ABS2CWD4_9FLAO|nr:MULTISPECIES: translesion error-prone DNA polymerase V autoproteolytic subunit [Flavobacterium]MBM6499268.1 translesion error-prone DNA polymerase V autoproteolytic subunit [Flavobacterium macrobrachii]MCZ8090960.1 translesion error-prone DNA polymerase V autoproteolytic subunit [Flavobacterium sp.]MCZ8331686.1 translesion error-prone DNA polymerase V autoproteolytic subunit [Flavobacterium sp.]PZO28402.1 MAG: peptidase S24 [Flavobacteriaceae bacterium]
MLINKNIKFFIPNFENSRELPFITSGIKAGFPSPAADFDETRISLDKALVKNPHTTFYAKANGQSMKGAGIDDGDIMVIDRSIEPRNNKIAVCLIDGEFTVKRIKKTKEELLLMPENNDFQPIKVTEENQFVIWGIVTYVIKNV